MTTKQEMAGHLTRLERLRAEDLPVREIAAKLGVSERTVHRYAVRIVGHRRHEVLTEREKRVLAHLRTYPHLWFTRCDIGRVLDEPYTTVRWTLDRLHRSGEVERRQESRHPEDLRPVYWWRLARGDRTS